MIMGDESMPEKDGYYWVQTHLVNGGLPDVVKVHVDEFDRLTAQACGCERVFTEDDLLGCTWAGPIAVPFDVSIPFNDQIPF
jgi:hypothetical protein